MRYHHTYEATMNRMGSNGRALVWTKPGPDQRTSKVVGLSTLGVDYLNFPQFYLCSLGHNWPYKEKIAKCEPVFWVTVLSYSILFCSIVMLHMHSQLFPITLQHSQLPYSLAHPYNDQCHFGNNPKHYPQCYQHHCHHLGDLKHRLQLTASRFGSRNLSLCTDLIFHT